MNRLGNLKRLLYPRHVAFIGGRGVAGAVEQCQALGFGGDLWVVNPSHETIAGRRCYARVEDLPAAPDAAFIAVRRETTVPIVRALAAAGGGGCVCHAAGFAEAGAQGQALEAELVAAAGELALVGPNCYGLLNYLDGVSLFPPPHGGERIERGVALLSQSGNISLNATMHERSVPLAMVVSIGNQAVLGVGDYIEALVEDRRIAAIGLYLEGITDVAGFSAAAVRAIARGVPLVVLKAGGSQRGEQVTLSHTHSLSGPPELYSALFERLGVISVGSLPALLETLKLLAVSGPPAGPRLAGLTASGGDGALLADRAAPAGLTLPPFSANQTANLRAQLASYAAIANPLDYNNPLWGDGEGLARCFATVMGGAVDTTVLVIDYPRAERAADDWDTAIGALIVAHQQTGRDAAVVSTLPEALPERVRRRLAANRIAPLQGLDEAMAALGGGACYSARRRQLADRGGADRLRLPAAAPAPPNPRVLDEWTSKRQLAAFGLRVPEARLASAAAAPGAAAEIGFPVAAKALGAALAHKTEAGAVALDLADEAAVARAVAALATIPGAGDRFLIERMIDGAIAELIVGVKRDDHFGLALVLGCGGVLVNLVAESRTLLLPTDRQAIAAALDALKTAPLIAGFRGAPAGDRERAIDAVVAIANFAERHRERLVALEVNPLVLSRGAGAVAVDAMIRMQPDPSRGRAREGP